MATFVKAVQSEELAKGGWEVVVQVQNPIFGREEGPGNPKIQLAGNPVSQLGVTAEEACDQVVFCGIFAENKADAVALDRKAVIRTAGPSQAVHESEEHFPVGEADAGLHGEGGRFGKASHEKCGKPPVSFGSADALGFVPAESEGTVKHFMVIRAGEPGAFIFVFGNNGVGMVYADFRPGIDTVLPLPEFDQPGFALIVEIDGKCVKNHMKTGCHIIVEPGISGLSLRCVCRGGKEAAVTVETVAEGVYQLVQKRTFGAAVHRIDFTDYLFSMALEKDTAEKSEKQ